MTLVNFIKDKGFKWDDEGSMYDIHNGFECMWVSFRDDDDDDEDEVEVGMLGFNEDGRPYDIVHLFDVETDYDEICRHIENMMDNLFKDDVNSQIRRGQNVKKFVGRLNDVVGEDRFGFGD